MFKVQYRLTDKLLGNVTQTERFYGQLEALRIPSNLELNLERDNLIRSSYISNSIEGNPLSLPEVTNLLLGDRVPVNRNEQEVKNYFDILKNLSTYTDHPLTLSLITQIHHQLLRKVKPDIAGKIRNQGVIVGRYQNEKGKYALQIRHNPPWHTKIKIEQAINELLAWVKQEKTLPISLKTGIFHHHFVYLHPFADGNGRTCRLLTTLLFLKSGYMINKYFILDDWYDIDRILYSDKLHSADRGNKTEWLEYFSDGIKYSLESALAKNRQGIARLNIKLRPTTKEQEVLNLFQEMKEMLSTDLAQRLSISRQQAHHLLSGLMAKGFLGKKGQTKASYYFLK
jgi:Fic family protein